MEWISQWARSLAFYFVFLSAVMNFLPDGEEKKYIRYYMGVVLLLFLLRPFLMLGNMETWVDWRAEIHAVQESYEEMKREMNVMEDQEYLIRSCREEMERQIGRIAETYGYIVRKCDIAFGGTSGMEPLSLYLEVCRKEECSPKENPPEILEKALTEVYKFPSGNINIMIQE